MCELRRKHIHTIQTYKPHGFNEGQEIKTYEIKGYPTKIKIGNRNGNAALIIAIKTSQGWQGFANLVYNRDNVSQKKRIGQRAS